MNRIISDYVAAMKAVAAARQKLEREHAASLLRVGYALLLQKERLPHGDWLPWVRKNMAGVSLRQVHYMLSAAQEWRKTGRDSEDFVGGHTWISLLRKHGIR